MKLVNLFKNKQKAEMIIEEKLPDVQQIKVPDLKQYLLNGYQEIREIKQENEQLQLKLEEKSKYKLLYDGALVTLEEFKTNGYSILLMKYGDRIKTNFKLEKAIEHILSDYKRVLKENEELKEDRDKFKKALGRRITYCNELEKDLFENSSNYVIKKQKVKDKIEELKKKVEELTDDKGYWGGSDLLEQIKVLQELLEKEQ